MTTSNDYTKYGEFSADGQEFVIRRFDTPRPWLNYAWNEQLLVSIDQRGRGHCLFRDGAGNRTLPIRDRFIFIKDRDDGSFWTVGWDPVKLPFEHYTCRHGLGYTVIESEVAGIRCAWTVTAAAGQPAELWALRVSNVSDRPRRLGVYAAVEFDLGGWYLRGFNDAGQPVGSQTCEDGKIFSEPQSWAFLAGLDPARLAQVTAAVDRHLRTPTGLVVCEPPFRHYDPQYGRISCMLPGWGENGSCYCHVTAFQAVADCLRRDGDAALASLTSIAPFNPALSVEQSWLEPYAFSNMFRGPAHQRPGATFKGWTSGTVPWALRCMTHFLLGVRPDYDALVIDPVLPSSWERVALTRTFRGAVFQIEIVNPGRVSSQNAGCHLTVDGQPVVGNRLACRDFPDGIHAVRVDISA